MDTDIDMDIDIDININIDVDIDIDRGEGSGCPRLLSTCRNRHESFAPYACAHLSENREVS